MKDGPRQSGDKPVVEGTFSLCDRGFHHSVGVFSVYRICNPQPELAAQTGFPTNIQRICPKYPPTLAGLSVCLSPDFGRICRKSA